MVVGWRLTVVSSLHCLRIEPVTSPIIRLEHVHFTYPEERGQPVHALKGVDLEIQEGEYVVIVGHNGSGKSTLAKHLNALLLPTEGDVWVNGWNTQDPAHVRDVRATVGMVFQSPDNQIVATIVEEDVAFGPENMGLPHDEIVRRVDWALEQVDMLPYRHRPPHRLSGGQKQRVAIAGMLAMRPKVLVLDEATAMLDPRGRQEVLAIAHRLNREEGVTIVAITHFMEEAVNADRLIVMVDGRIQLQGTPREVFRQVTKLRQWHMEAPPITQLAWALHEQHPHFPGDVLTVEEFVQAMRDHARGVPSERFLSKPHSRGGEPVIRYEGVGRYYMRGTPLEVKAIEDVTMEVRQGEILGLIGHTGSGKSTIIQHANALLRPHEGRVWVFGQDTRDEKVDLRAIRRRVGLVFQQPENQLFERFVGDDIAFGPRNLGLSREEVRARVREAMEAMGLGFEAFKDRMTFSLSGGEMRRVALAGVLALRPEVLVLDEPTAGLDPWGRAQLLESILTWREQGATLVLVSHNMENLAHLADRLYVVAQGTILMEGSPATIFSRVETLQAEGLNAPVVTLAMQGLVQAGLLPAQALQVHTMDEAVSLLGGLL